jgi:hypothetical protein
VKSLPSKRRILKERERERSKDSKEKEVKPQLKSSMFKKREDEIYMLLGEILSKEKKERRSQIPIVQNLMCGLIHTHTSFAFALPSIP